MEELQKSGINNSEVVAQILLELHELKERITPEEERAFQKLQTEMLNLAKETRLIPA